MDIIYKIVKDLKLRCLTFEAFQWPKLVLKMIHFKAQLARASLTLAVCVGRDGGGGGKGYCSKYGQGEGDVSEGDSVKDKNESWLLAQHITTMAVYV